MKKVFDQTFRDIKREVNKKVLKVPGIEQKVLDATSNEPWGPHGTLLADIAQATRNYHEYQMIMTVIWKRINDIGKNWRHVYKALTVLEYVVAHGSERVIDDIREHSYQISTLSNFQYIDSSGRDQGNNVRKKSQSLVALVNDNERIIEVRQKAAANRDKFRKTSAGGMYRPGSGGYGDRYDYDRYEGPYGSRDDDQNGYGSGREREYGYRDDDWYGRNGGSYSRDGDRYGRDYEDRYSRDGYRDDDYRGRSRSVDDYQDGSGRSFDRNRASDDGSHLSTRRLERKFSEQNIGAPPNYEDAVSESRSPIHSERDGEGPAPGAPSASSPHTAPVPPHPPPVVPESSSPPSNQQLSQATNSFGNFTPANQEVVASDEFDPRGSLSASTTMSNTAAPATSNGAEMDLLGSLSDSFPSDALAIMPAVPATSAVENAAYSNSGSVSQFGATQSASNVTSQTFEDPFGDSPFKAIPSTDPDPAQQQTSASAAPFHSNLSQNSEMSQLPAPNMKPVPNFEDSFYGITYSSPSSSNVQPSPANSQFLPEELSTWQQDTDILADILPPSGSSSAVAFEAGFPTPTDQPSQPSAKMYESFRPQMGSVSPVASNTAPQVSFGSAAQHSSGNFISQGSSTAPVMASHSPPGTAAQFDGRDFLLHPSSEVPVSSHIAPQNPIGGAAQQSNELQNNLPQAASNSATASQPAVPPSTESLAIVPQPQPTKDKFEPKSAVWADTLSRGLVNLSISGPKTNPLADIGVDFDAINRKEKRMGKPPPQTTVTSTVTMGKAMGSGSGLGRVGASAVRPPPKPMMGSNMGMGMGGPGLGMSMSGGPGASMGMGLGMGGYGGMNQPMGMGPGMGMNAGMNMGMGQGVQMEPQTQMMATGSTMPAGYRPMMGASGYSPQQPYGGGYR